MTTPISIVIPCHNDERWVADAVNSSLEQTLRPLEIIVVDDGSTDNSRSILKSFGDKITLIETPQRGGCAARNTGWQAAKGEWIQFLDSDDVLYANKLEVHYQIALAAADKEITYCGFIAVDADTGKFMYETLHPPAATTMERVLLEPITPLMPLFKRSSLEEVAGFTEGLTCMQDRDLNYRLWEKGYTFTPLGMSLYTSRRRPGSVSSNPLRCFRQYHKIYENLINKTSPRQSEADLTTLAMLFANASRHFAAAGKFGESAEFHKTSMVLDPKGIDLVYGPLTKKLLKLGGPALANIPLGLLLRLKEWKKKAASAPVLKVR